MILPIAIEIIENRLGNAGKLVDFVPNKGETIGGHTATPKEEGQEEEEEERSCEYGRKQWVAIFTDSLRFFDI